MRTAELFSGAYWVSLWRSYGELIGIAIAKVVVILVAYILVRYLTFRIVSRLFKLPLEATDNEHTIRVRKARVLTLQSIVRSVAGFVLAFVTVIMVVQAVGYNAVPILATASVAGVAIGFGAQKLVRDVITGFFILMEDQYGVGEYVTIGAVTGTVQELGIRTTRIRDSAGKLFIISNGDISQVCNHSRGALRISLDIALPASIDLVKAREVLDQVGRSIADELPDMVREPFKCEGLANISGSTATVRLVGGVVARCQDQAQMELKGRIREAFAENELALA